MNGQAIVEGASPRNGKSLGSPTCPACAENVILMITDTDSDGKRASQGKPQSQTSQLPEAVSSQAALRLTRQSYYSQWRKCFVFSALALIWS